jgi:hypothetical protein
MSRDPIVEEVRAIRPAIAEEHGNDLKRIIGARLKPQVGGTRQTPRAIDHEN